MFIDQRSKNLPAPFESGFIGYHSEVPLLRTELVLVLRSGL